MVLQQILHISINVHGTNRVVAIGGVGVKGGATPPKDLACWQIRNAPLVLVKEDLPITLVDT